MDLARAAPKSASAERFVQRGGGQHALGPCIELVGRGGAHSLDDVGVELAELEAQLLHEELGTLFEKRGLTEVLAEARELLARIGSPQEAPDVDLAELDRDARAAAEQHLWSWYLEWSSLARLAISDGRVLRALGFRRNEKKSAAKEEVVRAGAVAVRHATGRPRAISQPRTRAMEFFVYSRGAIERLPPHDVPHVIISIVTSPDDQARLPASERCRGVLRLVFSDLDEATPDAPSAIFSVEHARAIWDFVECHAAEISRVVLHCDAGISRSPGVAAALAKCLTGDDTELFRRYRPNMRVYRTLLDVWHERRSEGHDAGRTSE